VEIITYDIHEPRLRYENRTGIYPSIVDFDDLYKTLEVKPILANDIDLSTEQGRDLFTRLVYSRHDGDMFSNVPSCACGFTTRGSRINTLCKECGQPVLPLTEMPIQPIIWIRCPDKLPGFMNLMIYRHLKLEFTKSGFSALDYIIDPSYRAPKADSDEEAVVVNILGNSRNRGLKYFHDNFDDVMDALCASRFYIKTAQSLIVKKYLAKFRHLVFCKYLPFPSKVGFIIENVGERTFADPRMAPAISALISLSNAAFGKNLPLKDLEKRVGRSIGKLTQYYMDNESKNLFDKSGIFRKLVYGTDPHFNARTVITPLHQPHNHDSIETPWGVSILMLKLHIANKLLKEDYTPNEISTLIYDNITRTQPKLESIIDELIAETPGGKGIPVGWTRFPVLLRGSTSRKYITAVKRNPTQLSTSTSPLTVNASNADFDGDYMTIQMALDAVGAAMYDRLADHTGIMDLKHPFKMSNHAAIPAPTLTTINARLEEGIAISRPVEV